MVDMPWDYPGKDILSIKLKYLTFEMVLTKYKPGKS